MSIESNLLIDSEHLLERLESRLRQIHPIRRIGTVAEIRVTTLRAMLPNVVQGELCEIESTAGSTILGEVIGFDEKYATISCLQSPNGIALGAEVRPLGKPHSVKVEDVGEDVLDGMGRSLAFPENRLRGVLSTDDTAMPVIKPAPPATSRPPVSKPFETGVKLIDNLITLGVGQRVGLFAPPGCGKSTLMAQIVRGAKVDAVVFGLVGERGRELREFMENEISDDIRQKSYFVCATSDRSPVERVRAAFTATSIAEYLRDKGKNVLLVIDSLTRLARAQRELGLMAGEPATQSGFTPSVYSILPELIERAGRTETGNLTAIYTVLMERAELEEDPIASEAKSLLDGHIILSSKLVEKSQFPAIDPLKSLSRVMSSVADANTIQIGSLVRQAYSLYSEVELLLRLNEYEAGNNPMIDEAIRIKPLLDAWCKQDRFSPVGAAASKQELAKLVNSFGALAQPGRR
ncbi:MAG: FliI/YscN family ATPase [Limnobacter sp.]|nr:FliI/YscN family ATPase [Limnobacter sp.]